MARASFSIAAAAQAATVPRARHIFVSYSHLDGPQPGVADSDMPRRFHQELLQLAENWPALGITRQTIFFDRQGLRAGDDWEQVILDALERAEVFIFLATSHALSSEFCVRRELKTALDRGIRIVPVLLRECQWRDRLIDDDPQGRRLGRFDAVPKNEFTVPLPIALWPDRDSAWARTMEQLRDMLQHSASEEGGAVRDRRRPALLAPLLPFECNQWQAEAAFDVGTGQAEAAGKALLVLVRGEYADHTPGFWDRLRCKNLADVCGARGLHLLEERPVKRWPAFNGQEPAGPLVSGAVTLVLSDALTGSRQRIHDAADLAEVLSLQAGVLPLQISPIGGAGAGLSRSLRAALDLIEATPEGTALDKLALAVLIEDPALLDEPDLKASLGLQAYRRTWVVELARLQPLTPADVRQWHEDQDLEQLGRIDPADLVQRVFAGSAQQRMRPFEKIVRPLLGL